VYCPFCGREMSLVDGVFTCVAGGMPFSRHMHETLAERFPVQAPRPPGVVVGHRLTHMYAPGCGVPLDPELKCPSCGGSIRDQLFGLVERHPHREG
jgi:hypothetical protein